MLTYGELVLRTSSELKIFFLFLLTGLQLSDASSGISRYTMPDGFMLGVATAAYQIEGGWNEGGKGESMWDTYIHNHSNFTMDHLNGDSAADSYNKYKEDIQIIKALGVSHYRMSISWTRILPNGTDNYVNKEGIKHYRNIFNELLQVNVTPVVTIYHWDLPTMFMEFGGWTNPKIVDYYEDYVRVVFKYFGDLVKMWITINEPRQHCYFGYGSDLYFPALKSSGIGDYLCSHYMLLAHARAYRLYEKEFKPHQKGKIGITYDAIWMEPKDSTKQDDIKAAEMFMQMHFALFVHPIFSSEGNYPQIVRQKIDSMSQQQKYTRSRLPKFSSKEVKMLKGSADFIGLNHYTSYVAFPSTNTTKFPVPSVEQDSGVETEQPPYWPTPGVEWLSVYPEGIRKLINWVSKNYKNVPIIITENGLSDDGQLDDYERVAYINEYIDQTLMALYEDGCHVQGYFAWTLMDDFEWKYGYTVKFGLYHVDYQNTKKSRIPKLSAYNFREIARTRRVNFDFIKNPLH